VIQPGLALFPGTGIFHEERLIGKRSRARGGRWPGILTAGRGGKAYKYDELGDYAEIADAAVEEMVTGGDVRV
jgi:hypothetical protein